MITCRRADGREIALDRLPLAGELSGRATHLLIDLPPDLPPVMADRGRVVQVLNNLFSNAALGDALTAAGYSALATGEHQELASIIHAEQPALVLLDLILPGTDGIELMERVPELADLPVIFISGYGRDETIAQALEAGAADYIVKPFSPTELIARIRAALRRRAGPEPFVLGELAIHYEQRRVTVAGRLVELTATEFELLRVLAVGAGRVVTYDTLLRQAWRGRSDDRKVVRAFVRNVRRKLGDDPNQPAYIVTERGVGYRMARPHER